MDEARAAGFDVYGIEPSLAGATVALQRGLRVHCGSCPSPLPDGFPAKFDVVVAWDVLEHVYSPLNFLKACHALTSRGGSVHITTLLVDSLFARILGAKWPWYMPMHISYFDRSTLVRMFEDANLSALELCPNRHYVFSSYLAEKLLNLRAPLRWCAPLVRLLPDIIVPVSLGDTVYARAISQ